MEKKLLGTDPLGRDLLSRLVFGARTSLTIGAAGMTIGLVIGTASGMVAGFARGRLDDLVMFLVDAYVSLPFLVIALSAVALLGNTMPVLIGLASMANGGTPVQSEALTARLEVRSDARHAGPCPGAWLRPAPSSTAGGGEEVASLVAVRVVVYPQA